MASYTSSAYQFLQTALAAIQDNNFQRDCVSRLLDRNVTSNVSAINFINGVGELANDAIADNSASIWGISYESCTAFCNYKDMPFPFDYTAFSSALTNYLLPWLALTAQLPYETGRGSLNWMALFLALGSPVMITYSLSLTVVHSYKLKQQFDRLKRACPVPQRFNGHLTAIQEVLQTAQHVPLRASQRDGWLSSLLALEDNDDWWDEVRDYIRGHVRDFSPSAFAQIGVAVVAWLLTIVAALATKLGDPDTGLQMASGSLWIWLVPVVVGYIKVGVPNSSKATRNAFAQPGAHRAGDLTNIASPTAENPVRIDGDGDGASSIVPDSSQRRSGSRGSVSPLRITEPEQSQQQQAVEPDHLTVPPAPAQRFDSASHLPQDELQPAQRGPDIRIDANRRRGIQTSGDWFTTDNEPNSDLPTGLLGRPILGDSNVPGAAYTYARSLEFPFFVGLLTRALGNVIEQDPDRTVSKTRQGDPEAIAKLCGSDWRVNMNLNPFPRWSQVSIDGKQCMLIAAAVALFVQWGTTMASFMIAYLTPVQGLGCRSGSYIVYAVVSTAAWLFLVLGQICSNSAMRILQERAWLPAGSTRPTAVAFSRAPGSAQSTTGSTQQARVRRQSTVQVEEHNTAWRDSDWKLAFMSNAAILLRLGGKALCVLNTIWLLLTSVAEVIGGFDQCWCLANRPSTGLDSWIVLFKTSADLASRADSSWGGGFAITIIVSILAITFFVIGSPKRG